MADDPSTWFPMGGGTNGKKAAAPDASVAPSADNPATWFPMHSAAQPPQQSVEIDPTTGLPLTTTATAPATTTLPTSLEDLRTKIQQGDISVLNALKPGPDAGPAERYARVAAMVPPHLLAGLGTMAVNALIGFGQQPGTVAPLTTDPVTGATRLTPEAQTAGSVVAGAGGRDIQFSGPSGLQFVPPATRRGAPIPADVAPNLLSPDVAERLRSGTVSPAAPPTGATGGAWRPVQPGEIFQPGGSYRMNVATGQQEVLEPATAAAPAAAPASPTGIPVTPPKEAPAPPGTAPPQPAAPSAPSSTPGATPTTPAEALPIATTLLEKARTSGADLQPGYTNKFIDKVTADATPAGPGTAAVAGPNDPVAAMVQRLQALRDQPLSIQDVMGMDRELNARQRAAIKTDPDLARRLGDLQDSLRDQVDAATEADVGGGADGWNAFKDGRAAYSQYKKMQAVEDMKERADGMQNPTSSYKTAVNNFVTSPKARGWTDEEKASLVDSADRGVVGGTLHLLGSRLLPHVAGAVGASVGGIPGFITGEALAHFGGGAARYGANALQTQRVGRTMGVLGSSIPNPLQQPPP